MLCATAASTGPGVFESERRCRRFNWSSERVVVATTGPSACSSGRDAGGDSDGSTALVLPADEGTGNGGSTDESTGNGDSPEAGGLGGRSGGMDMGMTAEGCCCRDVVAAGPSAEMSCNA